MKEKTKMDEAALLVVRDLETDGGRYTLLSLRLWNARVLLAYAEQNGEAACALLPHVSTEEADAFLRRAACGGLSPLHLSDAVEDLLGAIRTV